MAEEEKSQKIVESYKAVAAGIASVLAAVFTSKLGVAGTLIGTALTGVLITLVSAVLKVQLMKATDSISGIPSAVQGRLSTQQIRIPGKPNPEPNPEPARRGRLRGLLSRLRAMPGFLRDLPRNQRRRMLVAGLLSGLVAAAIGLSTVTGIELAEGETLSCLVWDSSCPEEDDSSSSGSSRGSGLSIFGGYASSGTPAPDTKTIPPDGAGQPGEQPFAPGDGQPGQPQQQPGAGEQPAQQQPGLGEDATPRQQQSGGTPQEGGGVDNAGESQGQPKVEQPAPDDKGGGEGSEQPAQPGDQGRREGNPPKEDSAQTQTEDRGSPRSSY